MDLYQTLKQADIEIDNHESDLYFPINKESTKILNSFPSQLKISRTFIDQISGQPFYEVPFGFTPFFEGLLKKQHLS